MYFTGMTTGALTPWIEERIYRGFILQGLLPYVGVPGAVCPHGSCFLSNITQARQLFVPVHTSEALLVLHGPFFFLFEHADNVLLVAPPISHSLQYGCL
jgi:hypothetical protein